MWKWDLLKLNEKQQQRAEFEFINNRPPKTVGEMRLYCEYSLVR